MSACSTLTHSPVKSGNALQQLQVSTNGRFLQYQDGQPFFWLADTAWLLFQKLSREEAERYLDDRKDKGFNVIQVMVIHDLPAVNFYGDYAFNGEGFTEPKVSKGHSFTDEEQYDYWDHVDYIADLAAKKGLYLAMVPAWGTIAKKQPQEGEWAAQYADWLGQRFAHRINIIWLNGGDIYGNEIPQVWEKMGTALDKHADQQLITFHPRGRTQSSTWFHNSDWLDFNMFQSGHRRYDQIGTDDPATWKGEDNWRYINEDYARLPIKPSIDGEPSYENIPRGLHDPKEGYWNDADTRRYAYWSVFAGAFGHTFGNNAVMQMHKPNSGDGAFGVRNYWYEGMHEPGAGQMQYLKNLMLSRPYFERVPAQNLIAGANGDEYNYLVATRGQNYAFIYTYTGRSFDIDGSKINAKFVTASWYNPQNGETSPALKMKNHAVLHFDPPGEEQAANDWVLILDFK
ncbi:glycoside hydrolase [Paraglaciecola hydrolytica]|uniref:Glycoside hydrolase n=2 Tax=Paraglaciecola hydrolytica TaxID=1799789 RepID=A0A148KKS6_9ALTE|nr:glycoside hydrolase [Paraglaciecola hydrolytica]